MNFTVFITQARPISMNEQPNEWRISRRRVKRRARQELKRHINETGSNETLDQAVGCMRGLGGFIFPVVENVNSSVGDSSGKRISTDDSELAVGSVLAPPTGRAPKLVSDRLEALQPLFAEPAQDAIRHSLPTGLQHHGVGHVGE